MHVLGGTNKAILTLNKFGDVYKVHAKTWPRRVYSNFRTVDDVKAWAEKRDLVDIVSHCNFVLTHGNNAGAMLERIKEHLADADDPGVVLQAGTIHQSKGGEWDHVIVMPDVFAFLQQPSRPNSKAVWVEPWWGDILTPHGSS